MNTFRISVTYGLLLGLIGIVLTGSLGFALAAAATAAAAILLGVLLSRRLLTPRSYKSTSTRRRTT
ncbi:hypothetical protein ACFWV1_25975 [Streptomyces sp. NPDC058700]|uniref:hypothetical protein n=1 Tax=Streptomyces sp. NPDC058700 TaxID=3346607 RepID=UPI00364D8373